MTQLPAEIAPANRLLTAAEYHRLADVPPEVEWFANLSNAHTKRVYENAIRDFMRFTPAPAKQQMRWSPRGAHLMLKVRTSVVNGTFDENLAAAERWACRPFHKAA
jgi:hypothetical protein